VAEGDVAAMRVREDDTMNEAVPWEKFACRFGCDPNNHPVVGLYFAPHGASATRITFRRSAGSTRSKGSRTTP